MALVLPQRGQLDWDEPVNEALTTLDTNITTLAGGAFTKAQADALYDALNTAANLIAQHSSANDPHADRDWATTRFLALTGGTLSGPITTTNIVATGDITASSLTLPPGSISSSKTMVIPSPTVTDYVVWRAPKACTVVAVRGYRQGGTGATINAKVNSLNLLALDLSLVTADSWLSNLTIQNAVMAAGDSLIFSVRSLGGSPTSLTIQIDTQGA